MATHALPGTRIEIARPLPVRRPRGPVLFDFDGTLSLIRAGWSDIMVPMMVDTLLGLGTEETREELTAHVKEYVMRLTGRQTLFQMRQLAAEVRLRGGEPLDPLEYKRQYNDLLRERIAPRRHGLADGTLQADSLLLPGARRLLSALRDRGLHLVLASGTDEPFVREEAQLLGIDTYFGDEVHGARDDPRLFSKRQVIQQLLKDHDSPGENLLSFGDGYVEIEETVAVGGLAVGVACHELRPGQLDAWKRQRLLDAGAAVIIPDYTDYETLLECLFDGRHA